MMKSDIQLPAQFGLEKNRKFSLENIESFFSQVPKKISGNIIIDASRTEWIEPVGFVLLRSLAERLSEKGFHINWAGDENKQVKGFLEQMGFFSEEKLRKYSARYVPLIKVHEDKLNEVVTQLKEILKKDMPSLDERILKLFDFSVSELLQNIFQHSEKEYGCISAMAYPNKNRLQFALVDNGIGIRKSLLKNPMYASTLVNDEGALSMAIHPKVTSNPATRPLRQEGNAGEGLFWAAEFSKEPCAKSAGRYCFMIHNSKSFNCLTSL